MYNECTHASTFGSLCPELGPTVGLQLFFIRKYEWNFEEVIPWNTGYDKTGNYVYLWNYAAVLSVAIYS